MSETITEEKLDYLISLLMEMGTDDVLSDTGKARLSAFLELKRRRTEQDALSQRVAALEDAIVACAWGKYRSYHRLEGTNRQAVLIDRDQWYALAELIEPAKFQIEPKSLLRTPDADAGSSIPENAERFPCGCWSAQSKPYNFTLRFCNQHNPMTPHADGGKQV